MKALESILKTLKMEIEKYGNTISQEIPAAIVMVSFSKNESFAFRAYQSFSIKRGEELIVISLDGKEKDSTLAIECDISDGNGFVLVHGPSAKLLFTEAPSIDGETEKWIDLFNEFLGKNRALVISSLRQAL